MAPKSERLLRAALGLNSAFSLASGLLAVLFATSVAQLIGTMPPWLISALGVGLLVFASGIAWVLLRLRVGLALLISGLDFVWVLVTVPLTLVDGLFTPVGQAIVLAVAAIVGMLGMLQLAGIRALLKAGAQPGQYRHCIRLRSSADPDRMWHVIRDLGGISQYSAGLSASRLEGGSAAAPGSVRVCTNTGGQSWAEEVISLDDSARSVVFRFRSEAPDFPFPLAALSGGWSVASDGQGGALVDIWWLATPRQRHLGWLVVAMLAIPLDHDLPAVVGAMEATAMDKFESRVGRRLSMGYC